MPENNNGGTGQDTAHHGAPQSHGATGSNGGPADDVGGGRGFTRRETDAPTDAVMRLIARAGGNGEDAVTMVLRDNAELREKNRELRNNLQDVQRSVPAQGAVVLTADEAKLHAALKAAGITTETQFTERMTAAQQSAAENASIKAEQRARQAAPLAGYDPDAFVEVARDKNLTVEIASETAKDAKGADTTVKVPYVVPVGADGKPGAKVKLTDYVSQHLKVYEPSLKATSQQTGGGHVTPYPQQGSRANMGSSSSSNGSTQQTGTQGGGTAAVPGSSRYVTPSARRAKQG